jgi:hypothetical protein
MIWVLQEVSRVHELFAYEGGLDLVLLPVG